MAYNNGFPMSYQPMQYYPQSNVYQVQPQQQQQNSSIIWVQGEAGAKSYLVAPNTTVQLWDSESQTIYLKSADASGMPSIKVLDYTIRSSAPEAAVAAISGSGNNYITLEDLKPLQRQIDAIRDELGMNEGSKLTNE